MSGILCGAVGDTSTAPLAVVVAGDASCAFSTPGLKSSGSIALTPSGGIDAYAVEWSYVSGSTGPTCNAATSLTTNWNCYCGSVGASKTAIWQWTVTDSVGDTVTGQVTVSFTGSA